MKSFFKGNYLKCPLSLNIKFIFNKDALILLCMNFFAPISYIYIAELPTGTLKILTLYIFLSFLWVYTFIIIPTCIYKFINFFGYITKNASE